MKLDDLLTESPLASFGKGYAGPRLGPNNIGFPNGDTVKELKRALKRHTIYIPGQPFNPAQKAWIGDDTGEWSQALSDAVITWKKSINAQDSEAKLDISTPELGPRDIKYLLFTKLYADRDNAGLIQIQTGGGSTGTIRPPTWTGQTVDLATKITTPVENIRTVKDFLQAITFSGWAIILQELVNKKELGDNAKPREIDRMLKEIYVKQNHTPVIWLQHWEDNVLREQGENLTATLENGTELPFHPTRSSTFDTRWGSMAQGSQRLYQYFAILGNGLLEKYNNAHAAELQKQEEKPTVDDSQTLETNTVDVWIRNMNDAIYNSWIDYIPGVDGIDEKSVSDLMGQLTKAGDWDQYATAYEQKFEDNLGAELARKLSDDDYNNIVVRHLTRVNRISPQVIFAAINFGNTQDSVNVEYNNENYTIMKAMQQGKIVVKKGSKPVKDVLVVDAVLRIAVNESGGSVPDLNKEFTDENIQDAAAIVVAAAQTIPFLVPYYTAQSPFDQALAPGQGPSRLVGLQEQSARLLANGLKNEAVMSWLVSEMKRDAEYLIELEELHWDRKWQEESGSEILKQFGGILDVDDATEEELDLVDKIHSNVDNQREEAFAEILASNDVVSYYERIYRIFEREYQETIDRRIFNNKIEPLQEYIMNDVPFAGELESFTAIVNEIGVAKAAPYLMAKIYTESMKGEWWQIFGGTKEDLATRLTDRINHREDYMLVNEYYKKSGGSRDLIEDLDAEYLTIFGEGDVVERLKAALGEQTTVDAARVGLNPQLLNLLGDVTVEPLVGNLKRLSDAMNTPSNNYFTKDPEADRLFIDNDKLRAVTNVLDGLVEQGPYEDEQKELFFEILDGIYKEVTRITPDEAGPGKRKFWFFAWYSRSKRGWFS